MALNVAAPVKGPRVLQAQRETVVAFMEQHPLLAIRSSELGPRFTVGDRRRLWQQLADALKSEGPVVKTTEQWKEWSRKQVFAAAISQEQRSTEGWRLHGFRGRVLQLTETVRLHGVTDLPYQEQADIPTSAMEVVVQATDEAAGVRSTATPAEDPPRGPSPTERVAAAPVLQRPVRPPRRHRPRRVNTLTTMSSQCARSVEQGDEMLQVLRRIEACTTRLGVAAERTAAAQEGILEQVRAVAQDIAAHLQQDRN
ncbi:uncharacterized protein [Dermacentor andersoni]|uniref:uncharacterized protein n=1 Tax=Dermacentor andersoni TaxID=34620 RepID=UPI0024180A67|nr:uncharacterized protein LOC129386837 [Dermacentor andersoni]